MPETSCESPQVKTPDLTGKHTAHLHPALMSDQTMTGFNISILAQDVQKSRLSGIYSPAVISADSSSDRTTCEGNECGNKERSCTEKHSQLFFFLNNLKENVCMCAVCMSHSLFKQLAFVSNLQAQIR